MTRDTLDDLLDRSAPATRDAARADLHAMIVRAGRAATPRRRLLRRVALGGAVAALLAGSAGVAVAQSMMPHGFDDPWDAADYRHSFALPSGRGCELRIMV